MAPPGTSRWPELLELALAIIDQANERGLDLDDWSFGGGTALMLQIDHRDSHDIDLFVTDPQVLPFLNPDTQGFRLGQMPDGIDSDGVRALKLIYTGLGEIDFICSTALTPTPCETVELLGRPIRRETAGEIIARKVVFRGHALQPRDMFDIAATAISLGNEGIVRTLRSFPVAAGEALKRCRAMDAGLARAVMGQLMARPAFAHLHEDAQDICAAVLEQAVA
ncbi:MAG: nucleotidyl transferase AbiEii/AbiGii toxin family protein [Rubellimicrobium sp.]|nr:nucleotidyl transferase AbiEii/AbiGii toxin family protein [Rubellimicrobium sp.]